MQKEDLKKQRDIYVNKIFWLSLQIAFIFSIPAAVGAIVGAKLDNIYGTGKNITIIILLSTFIFSWVLVVFKYRRLNNKIQEIEQAIKNK